MAVDFSKDFISQITAEGKSRGDALRDSNLVDIINNRTDISDKVKATRTQVLNELGASGITLGDITEETPSGKQLFNSIIEKGSTNSINGFIGDFKSILAEVGVTAQGTTNPFRTMLKSSVGEAAYLNAGFSTDVSRLIPLQFPQEVYTESKRVAASLMADPKTRPAGGRMLLMMMGGYRPSDFKALKIENIDFNTGLVKGLELKTDAKPGKKSTNVKIGYLPTAQRDIIKSIIGDKTSGLVFEKPSSLDKTIGDALKTSAIPQIEYLQDRLDEAQAKLDDPNFSGNREYQEQIIRDRQALIDQVRAETGLTVEGIPARIQELQTMAEATEGGDRERLLNRIAELQELQTELEDRNVVIVNTDNKQTQVNNNKGTVSVGKETTPNDQTYKALQTQYAIP